MMRALSSEETLAHPFFQQAKAPLSLQESLEESLQRTLLGPRASFNGAAKMAPSSFDSVPELALPYPTSGASPPPGPPTPTPPAPPRLMQRSITLMATRPAPLGMFGAAAPPLPTRGPPTALQLLVPTAQAQAQAAPPTPTGAAQMPLTPTPPPTMAPTRNFSRQMSMPVAPRPPPRESWPGHPGHTVHTGAGPEAWSMDRQQLIQQQQQLEQQRLHLQQQQLMLEQRALALQQQQQQQKQQQQVEPETLAALQMYQMPAPMPAPMHMHMQAQTPVHPQSRCGLERSVTMQHTGRPALGQLPGASSLKGRSLSRSVSVMPRHVLFEGGDDQGDDYEEVEPARASAPLPLTRAQVTAGQLARAKAESGARELRLLRSQSVNRSRGDREEVVEAPAPPQREHRAPAVTSGWGAVSARPAAPRPLARAEAKTWSGVADLSVLASVQEKARRQRQQKYVMVASSRQWVGAERAGSFSSSVRNGETASVSSRQRSVYDDTPDDIRMSYM